MLDIGSPPPRGQGDFVGEPWIFTDLHGLFGAEWVILDSRYLILDIGVILVVYFGDGGIRSGKNMFKVRLFCLTFPSIPVWLLGYANSIQIGKELSVFILI